MIPEGEVIVGDCLDVMATWPEGSVDAIVTDPPYGLGFMGKAWDDAKRLASVPPSAVELAESGRDPYPRTGKGPAAVAFDGRGFQSWCEAWAREAFRIAKPSAYLLAFGGTRTVHRLTCALEDAGWIIRDLLVWAYASGFPKSKASLKPAWEPIVMARKPGPLRMLAIDECRIPHVTVEGGTLAQNTHLRGSIRGGEGFTPGQGTGPATRDEAPDPSGRWPANVILTDPIFDGDSEGVVGGGETHWQRPETRAHKKAEQSTHFGGLGGRPAGDPADWYGDSGTYSRFFLIPKAERADREPVLGGNGEARVNLHPTVKPTELMRHLVRLVTPTGGLVLDPFLGSGTTALAAEQEGFRWVGIEREPEYAEIARARLNGTQRGLGLDIA